MFHIRETGLFSRPLLNGAFWRLPAIGPGIFSYPRDGILKGKIMVNLFQAWIHGEVVSCHLVNRASRIAWSWSFYEIDFLSGNLWNQDAVKTQSSPGPKALNLDPYRLWFWLKLTGYIPIVRLMNRFTKIQWVVIAFPVTMGTCVYPISQVWTKPNCLEYTRINWCTEKQHVYCSPFIISTLLSPRKCPYSLKFQ